MLVVALCLLLQAEPKSALEALQKNPDDQKANKEVGLWKVGLGAWEEALPMLAKSGDKDLAALASKELAAPTDKLELVELADGWTKVMGRFPKIRTALLDRASGHYATAWPDLDDAGKAKLRQRANGLYAVQGRASALKTFDLGTAGKSKIEIASGIAHSGVCALKIAPGDDAGLRDVARGPSFAVKPGEIELTFWIHTDGLDTLDDVIGFAFFNSTGQQLAVHTVNPKKDLPIWERTHLKVVLPDGVTKGRVAVLLSSRRGVIRVDDFSARQGGKELVENGGFEQ